MRCVVTAGPTWEPLDRVRRLTNLSTGSLGGSLANALALAGHEVTLLLSDSATWRAALGAVTVEGFSTAESLAERLRHHATTGPIAVFQAAAVGDFRPGRVFLRAPDGTMTPVSAGKLDSAAGCLMAELVPTPKILPNLRDWYPEGRITGWKYEVEGSAGDAVNRGQRQLDAARTDSCVVNGPALGAGFTLLRRNLPGRHLESRAELISTLVSGL